MTVGRPLVLIVDDDVELRTMLREYLANEQFDVEACADGSAALRWLDRQRPDIVLLDVTMPGPNGFEVLKRLRTGSAVPVLMLTARDDQVDRILGFEFGADDRRCCASASSCSKRVCIARRLPMRRSS